MPHAQRLVLPIVCHPGAMSWVEAGEGVQHQYNVHVILQNSVACPMGGGVSQAIPSVGKVHLCVIAVCWEEIMLLWACSADDTMVYYARFNFFQGKNQRAKKPRKGAFATFKTARN